jgi:hypothetical protein
MALVLVKSSVRREVFDPDWAERIARLIGRADTVLSRVRRPPLIE